MGLKYGDPGYMEQDSNPMLYQITFTCLGVAIIVVILRLFSRLYLLRARRLFLPEWLIIASILLDIASCILIHFQIKTGMGKHIEYSRARPAMLRSSMKVGLAQNSVYQALIGVIKMSILTQLHSFAVPGVQQKVVLWTGVVVVVFTLLTTFSAIFQCIPMHAAWDLDHFPKGCWNMMAMNFFTSTINTLLDLIIFVIPIPTLMGLHMQRKKKISLLVTYCVGSLAIACSIIRLRNMIYFRGVGDFTYVACMVPVWGAIECNAGIVCASFPFIMPIIKRLGGSVVESLPGSRPQPSNSGQTHALQQSKHKSHVFESKRESEWREVDSESMKPIADDFGWEEPRTAPKVTHRVEHVEHLKTIPLETV